MTEDGPVPDKAVLRAVAAAVPHRIWWEDAGGRVMGCNPALIETLGLRGAQDVIGRRLAELPEATELLHGNRADQVRTSPLTGPDGSEAGRLNVLPPEVADPDGSLAAVGRLSLGVAHDINTPLQFVSDNVSFLTDSFSELLDVFDDVAAVAERANEAQAAEARAGTDIEFLREEIPDALSQTQEGLAQVAQLISGLRDYAVTGTDHEQIQFNDLIARAAMISGNEWRYRAELDLFLDPDLPPLHGSPGELKQAVVSLIMHAVSSIDEVTREGELGTISIATFRRGDRVGMSIADNGAGLTPEARRSLFDERTLDSSDGANLSAVAAIVASHGGALEVDSAVGSGTTIHLDLPVAPVAHAHAHAATNGAS